MGCSFQIASMNNIRVAHRGFASTLLPTVSVVGMPEEALRYFSLWTKGIWEITPSPMARDSLHTVLCNTRRPEEVLQTYHHRSYSLGRSSDNIAVWAPESMSLAQGVMSTVRLISKLAFATTGAVNYHAACIRLESGNGFMLTGQRGQGKTTAFLALLAAGGHAVANDQIMVRQGGSPHATAFPALVKVRESSLDTLSMHLPEPIWSQEDDLPDPDVSTPQNRTLVHALPSLAQWFGRDVFADTTVSWVVDYVQHPDPQRLAVNGGARGIVPGFLPIKEAYPGPAIDLIQTVMGFPAATFETNTLALPVFRVEVGCRRLRDLLEALEQAVEEGT